MVIIHLLSGSVRCSCSDILANRTFLGTSMYSVLTIASFISTSIPKEENPHYPIKSSLKLLFTSNKFESRS